MSLTLAQRHNIATNMKGPTFARSNSRSLNNNNNTKKKNKDNTTPYNTSRQNSGNPIVTLQKSIGNQAVQKLIHMNPGFELENTIQPKLKVSRPGDIYEQEADKVAEEIIKMSPAYVPNTRSVSRLSSVEIADRRERSKCEMKEQDREEKEKVSISRKPISNSSEPKVSDETSNHISSVHAESNSALMLDPSTKEIMESRFGHDFSKVRIHTGKIASTSADEINAIAYTVGNDVVFGQGQYRPDTLEGRKLLAHELTHVVQQSASSNSTATTTSSYAGLIRSKLNSAETISRKMETKNTSTEEIEKQFQQALLKSDWSDAVDKLAAFSITEIPKLLKRYMLTQSDLDLLKKAAASKFGSEGNKIVSAIDNLVESKK